MIKNLKKYKRQMDKEGKTEISKEYHKIPPK